MPQIPRVIPAPRRPAWLRAEVLRSLVRISLALATIAAAAPSSGSRAGLSVAAVLMVDAPGSTTSGSDTALPGIEAFTTGEPRVRWAGTSMPVRICTLQAGRPTWVTAAQFQAAVAHGAEAWNRAGAAVGYRYEGDCPSTGSAELGNGVNEVGFDEGGARVSAPTVAVTRGRWRTTSVERFFHEVDVVIRPDARLSERCLFTVVAHELGHGLGFGHSDAPEHLMYPSVSSSGDAYCGTEASAAERAWLIDLYGPNVAPRLTVPDLVRVAPGHPAVLTVGVESAHDRLAFRWIQRAGPAVDADAVGASLAFPAPSAPGTELRFEVEVFDPYLAKGSALITVVTVEGPPATAPSPPTQQPATFAFDPAITASGITLTVWQGGGFEVLLASLDGRMSVWVSVEGTLVGFYPGAPGFVNARFLGWFPDGIPAGTPILIARH